MAKQTDNEAIIRVFLLMCCVLGGGIGLVGLGVGLVFLSVPQAFGLGILTTGVGVLFAATIGCRRIVRAVLKTIRENRESSDHPRAIREYLNRKETRG